jgi:hypothetical protein
MATKVKLFQNVVSIIPGGGIGGTFTLEKEINDFLSSNSSIRLIDIKLSSNAAPVGERVTNYGLCALVIYE